MIVSLAAGPAIFECWATLEHVKQKTRRPRRLKKVWSHPNGMQRQAAKVRTPEFVRAVVLILKEKIAPGLANTITSERNKSTPPPTCKYPSFFLQKKLGVFPTSPR